jgi:FkbM family methyltransferase
LKNTITYLFTFAHTAKKFGIFNTVKLYIDRDFLHKKLLSFQPKGWKAPVYIRQNSSDWTVFQEVFSKRNYNAKIPFTPKIIVDCGANIGLASLYFMQRFPGVKVIAIEPEENNYNQLIKNLTQYKNAFPIQGGIWNRSAYLEVGDIYNMGSWGFSCQEIAEYKPGAVRAYSIDEVMSSNNIEEIDILKLDIEGAELELFTDNYDNWLPKTKCIIIELHDWRRKGCSKIFFNALFKYDFSIYTRGETIICYHNN